MPKKSKKSLPSWLLALYVFTYSADHLLRPLEELVKLAH